MRAIRGSKTFLLASLLPMSCGGPLPRVSAPTPADLPVEAGQPEEAPAALAVVESPVTFSAIDSSLAQDPDLEALVAPFRVRMGEEIDEVIGEAAGVLSKSVPEGTLGNFATDAMLWAANQLPEGVAELALTNNGGLRVPVGAGPITVGKMFELMPFENRLSILVLSGTRVRELCHQIAEKRGEPIAGFSFRIAVEDGRRVAQDIRVGGEPVDPDAEYRLVTNDYMANGGDSFGALENPLARIDLPTLLRDAFIAYVGHVKIVEPRMEGRITGGIGS